MRSLRRLLRAIRDARILGVLVVPAAVALVLLMGHSDKPGSQAAGNAAIKSTAGTSSASVGSSPVGAGTGTPAGAAGSGGTTSAAGATSQTTSTTPVVTGVSAVTQTGSPLPSPSPSTPVAPAVLPESPSQLFLGLGVVAILALVIVGGPVRSHYRRRRYPEGSPEGSPEGAQA